MIKAAAAAGAGYAAFKFVDAQLQISNDLFLLTKMAAPLSKVEKAPHDYTLLSVWDETVSKNPDKPAVVFVEDDSVLSFKELDELADKVANFLRSIGVKTGEAIALFVENRPEFLWISLGIAKAGAIGAFINTNNKKHPLVHALEIAHCTTLIFGAELQENVSEVASEIERLGLRLFSVDDVSQNVKVDKIGALPGLKRLEDGLAKTQSSKARKTWVKGITRMSPFAYIYTSGTTGLPKSAIVTHLRIIVTGIAGNAYGLEPPDRCYTCLPLYHSSGYAIGFGYVIGIGLTIVLSRKFSASRFMKDCTIHQATAIQYIGEIGRYLLNSPPTAWDRKHRIRIAIGNGLRREVWVPFQERFRIPQIGEFYGATEGNVAFINLQQGTLEGYREGVGAVGRVGYLARSSLKFKIVKHDVETEMPVRDPKTGFCAECALGEAGELLGYIDEAKPTTSFVGYTSKEATEKKILRDVLQRGDAYFRTGDLLRLDPDGYVYFVDRIGDTFRWKSENVSTNEVGEVVSVFPGIVEANIFGVKISEESDGRACMAGLILENGLDNFDLDAFSKHVHASLAMYAVPIFLRILPQMELTGTLKQRKVTFVKEGFDPTRLSDPLFYLDSESRRYKRLNKEAYLRIVTGKARL